MREMFEPSVDPWDLMIEHNKRIQNLEKVIQEIARTQTKMAQDASGIAELVEINTQSIAVLNRTNEQSLRLVMDIAGKLNIAQEK